MRLIGYIEQLAVTTAVTIHNQTVRVSIGVFSKKTVQFFSTVAVGGAEYSKWAIVAIKAITISPFT